MAKQQKPYTFKDFEAERDTNERLRMCLVQNEFFNYLTNREMERFNELYQTFALVYQAKNLIVPAEQIVMNATDTITNKAAKRMIADMKDVFEFGNTENVVKRNVTAQFHWELAQKARDMAQTPQELDYASKIAERASKLLRLENVKEGANKEPRRLPQRIILTDDVAVLIDQQPQATYKEAGDE